jgi:hypothetical protein
MFPRKRPSSGVFLVLIAGCSPSLPGTLVGESAHFRLFIDPDLDPSSLAPSQQGQQGLDSLETDWADKQTMLKMPEGKRKIDYHLMTGAHIAAACDFTEFVGSDSPAGCELGDTLQIAASYLPHQHELIHAYMELVVPDAVPVPLLVEGTAQSIGCGTQAGTDLTYDVPWQQAVMEVAADLPADVYIEGGLFARYLIRTQGIDAFVRYYQQAPGRRDPALFAVNFSAFWNMTVDDAWMAMHVVNPGAATIDEAICPCSLPALPTDGQPILYDVVNPYWTLGDTQGPSIAVTAPGGEPVIIEDCEGVTPELLTVDAGFPPNTPNIADANVAIFQLADGRSHYISAPISQASTGQYLADSCAGTTPYALPTDFLNGPGNLWIFAGQETAGSVTKYLQLQVPLAAQVTPTGGVEICDSCAFNQGSCQPPLVLSSVGVTSTVAPGLLNVELTLSPIPQGTTAAYYGVGSALQFTK